MSPSTEWWSTFFSGLSIELWTRLENSEFTRREVDLLLQALGVSPGARILDVPCGDGRHSLELAARGFDLTGVDISTENIAVARERAKSRGLRAEFDARDMRDLPFTGAFDAAFCVGNSFAYLTEEGNLEMLRAVDRALKPGAAFLLDTGVTAECLLPNLTKRDWYLVGDIYMLAERKHDPLRSRLDVEYTFIQGGTVERKPASYRIYTCLETVRLFEQTGFEVRGAFGGLGGEPFATGARSLCIHARKR